MWTTLVSNIKRGIEWTGLYYFDEPYTYRTIELDNASVPSKAVEVFDLTSVKVTDEEINSLEVKPKKAVKKATKPRKSTTKKSSKKTS